MKVMVVGNYIDTYTYVVTPVNKVVNIGSVDSAIVWCKQQYAGFILSYAKEVS